jgi:hypothetical protein
VRIEILPSALADRDRGRRFYARQGDGLGSYFLDSVFSDIDSLALYAGTHLDVYGFHRLLAPPLSVCRVLQGRPCSLHRLARTRLPA